MLNQIGMNAKAAEPMMRGLQTSVKNDVLRAVGAQLLKDSTDIIAANEKDMENGRKNGMPAGLLDRLMLNETRIAGMTEGLNQIADLDDPIGEIAGMKRRPNGLLIGQQVVPLGVIGIIYEARPNVTADAFGLCFKTGNVVIFSVLSACCYFKYVLDSEYDYSTK